ncbi:MAG: hypothetical protein R3E77_11250 [Steroidobacteraceae bacterium]
MSISTTAVSSSWFAFDVAAIEGPTVHKPHWLGTIQEIVRKSRVAPLSVEQDLGGEWLSPTVVRASIRFLELASPHFPAEPHLYGTRDGALHIEIPLSAGSMSAIVTNSAAKIVAIKGSTVVATVVDLADISGQEMQEKFAPIVDLLGKASSGTLDTK